MTRKEAMFKAQLKRRWIHITTLDPGIHATGWAGWRWLDRMGNAAEEPDYFGVNKIPQKIKFEDSCRRQCAWLRGHLAQLKTRHVVIEFPELWSGSAVSHAAATRGDLFKLTFLVGRYAEVCEQRGATCTLVTPMEWKGQMPKEVIDRRIKIAIEQEYPEHASDAVGIGLAIQDKL